jgi:hypothetical protein
MELDLVFPVPSWPLASRSLIIVEITGTGKDRERLTHHCFRKPTSSRCRPLPVKQFYFELHYSEEMHGESTNENRRQAAIDTNRMMDEIFVGALRV